MSKPSRSRGKDDSTSTIDTLHLIARDLNLTGSAWMGGNLIVTGSISGSMVSTGVLDFGGDLIVDDITADTLTGSSQVSGSTVLVGSGGLSVGGDCTVTGVISGSDYEGSLHMQVQSPSGPWVNVGYTGSDLPIPISGSVDSRQSGSWEVTISGGSIGLTGSSPLSMTLDGTAISGSIGITGSVTLPTSLVGTAVSGSVGITGSANVQGSVGITGSSTLSVNILQDVGKSITGSIGVSITGSTTLATTLAGTTVGISGSSATLPVTGSVGITTGISITGSSTIATTLVGTSVSGSIGVTGSANVQGSVGITGSATLPVSLIGTAISGSVGITGSVDVVGVSVTISNVRVTGSLTSALYSAYNFSLGGATGTGSGNFDVSQYSGKSAYAFIHTTQAGTGSLVVSGSFDGTNYFEFRSGSFTSGSLHWFTFFDSVNNVSVNLYNSGVAVISGSLYLMAQA